jgi:ribosomal protein S27AE
MPDYKPGDLPPEGYLQWHEWAEVQRKAGIKQRQCPTCGLWRTPQELSTRQIKWTVKDRKGHAIRRSDFECAKCEAKRAT